LNEAVILQVQADLSARRGFIRTIISSTVTTKDEKLLILVGRPSLAAYRRRARRPAPLSYFHIKVAAKKTLHIYSDCQKLFPIAASF
jgi:hypothetical protein